MITLSKAPQTITLFLKKVITFENGALFFMSAPFSDLILKVLAEIFQDVPSQKYAMPFIVAAVCIILYFSVYVMDFITGLRASRWEAENKSNYIKSDKLWSSIWKISVIFLIVFCLTIFSLIFAVLKLDFFHRIFMYSTAILSIMAMLFDLHSIGENHKRRFGKKPKIFDWLDQVSKAINEGVLKKIGKLLS